MGPVAHAKPATPSASLGFWSGRLFLWPGRALYVGHAADTAVHAHHAVQVCVALDGPFRLRDGLRARWRRVEAAVVGPDRPHQLDGRGDRLALLYLDPESSAGQTLTAGAARPAPVLRADRNLSALRALRAPLLACLDRGRDGGAAAEVVDRLVRTIAPPHPTPAQLDPRVARVLAGLRGAAEPRLSAAAAAALVGLSSHRFQHLFRDGTGVPFRRYLLWLRLIAAVEQSARGASLTDAAHAAGFADSAHLSRTFRRMFGLAPSGVTRRSEFVQARGRAST